MKATNDHVHTMDASCLLYDADITIDSKNSNRAYIMLTETIANHLNPFFPRFFVGTIEGSAVVFFVGILEGAAVNSFVGAIDIDGGMEGATMGAFVGATDIDGAIECDSEGCLVGAIDMDGAIEGVSEGAFVGAFDMDGAIEGLNEGASVGYIDIDGAIEGVGEGSSVGNIDVVGAAVMGPVNSMSSFDGPVTVMICSGSKINVMLHPLSVWQYFSGSVSFHVCSISIMASPILLFDEKISSSSSGFSFRSYSCFDFLLVCSFHLS